MATKDPPLGRPGAQFSWRRNLAVVWIAIFTAQFGAAFSAPFIPLFLSRDLGVHDQRNLALWTGVIVAAASLGAFVAQPLWGMVGDRRGRKPMVIRAMVGLSVTSMLMGLVPNPTALFFARLLMGTFGGVNPSGTAIVADGTPREHVAWALGIASSARAIGQGLGPLVGGVLISIFLFRQVFVAGGVLILFMLVPVALLLGESSTKASRQNQRSFRAVIARAEKGVGASIVTLGACSAFAFFAYSGAQQLIWLRLLTLSSTQVAVATGVTSAVLGLSTAVAAGTYSYLIPRLGFKGVAIGATLLLATSIACAAVANNYSLVVMCAAGIGLAFGALYPSVNTMLGLEAPAEIKATIFGLASSMAILGGGAGPLLGGAIASAWGLEAGLFVVALGAVAAFLLIWTRAREPMTYLHTHN